MSTQQLSCGLCVYTPSFRRSKTAPRRKREHKRDIRVNVWALATSRSLADPDLCTVDIEWSVVTLPSSSGSTKLTLRLTAGVPWFMTLTLNFVSFLDHPSLG